MLGIVNRVLLGLAGLGLMLLGAGVLLAGFDLPRPGFAPFDAPGDVLLSDSARQRYREDGWWWPVVIGGLAVLALAALWWLFAQLRQRRLGEVLIDTDEGSEGGGGALSLLRARALEDAMAETAGNQEGVERAHITLTGRRSAPQARVGLLLGAGAHPADAVRHLEARTLAQARSSTGLERIPAEVRLRAAKHRAERVS